MRRHLLRPLDRYVFSEFWKIFTMTALGFPVLIVVIDLTDNLDKYLNRQLPSDQIALSYLYFLPDSMFLVMPAAVLFATVFSIGALTRHAEITAAKASGISFYRLTLPIYLGAIFAAGLALALGELVPITNSKRAELLEEKKFQPGSDLCRSDRAIGHLRRSDRTIGHGLRAGRYHRVTDGRDALVGRKKLGADCAVVEPNA